MICAAVPGRGEAGRSGEARAFPTASDLRPPLRCSSSGPTGTPTTCPSSPHAGRQAGGRELHGLLDPRHGRILIYRVWRVQAEQLDTGGCPPGSDVPSDVTRITSTGFPAPDCAVCMSSIVRCRSGVMGYPGITDRVCPQELFAPSYCAIAPRPRGCRGQQFSSPKRETLQRELLSDPYCAYPALRAGSAGAAGLAAGSSASTTIELRGKANLCPS